MAVLQLIWRPLKQVMTLKRNQLSKMKTPNELAVALELEFKTLRFLVSDAIKSKYTNFSIPKKRGGSRTISAPIKTLKDAQRKLVALLETVYQPRAGTLGFAKHKDIVANANLHLRKEYVLNVDLEDFFPSITQKRIFGLLRSKPYKCNNQVASYISKLACDPTTETLPQGAPSSPILSNMICEKLDNELLRLAKANRCIYSRYVDDITFSTHESTFPADLGSGIPDEGFKAVVGPKLLEVILDNGFRVNTEKVYLMPSNGRQTVTGLKVNERPNVSRQFYRNIRAMLHSWQLDGHDKAQELHYAKRKFKHRLPEREHPNFAHIVRGKIEFLRMVRTPDSHYFKKFANLFNDLTTEMDIAPITLPAISDEPVPVDHLGIRISKEYLLANDEHTHYEAKVDPGKNYKDAKIAVASFLNTDGGVFVLGVSNDKKIVGVDDQINKLQKKDTDSYKLAVQDSLFSSLGHHSTSLISFVWRQYEGKLLLFITVRPSDRPIFLTINSESRFIRRHDGKSQKLLGDDIVNYISKRFASRG